MSISHTMKDWSPAIPTASKSEKPQPVQPSWFPEAKKLACACHTLASRVDTIDPRTERAEPVLKQTGQLLHVISDRLEHAIEDSSTKEPSLAGELCLDLIQYAKALPEASTKLWESEKTASVTDIRRSLPEVSIALITLSQHVTETISDRGSSVQCTPR